MSWCDFSLSFVEPCRATRMILWLCCIWGCSGWDAGTALGADERITKIRTEYLKSIKNLIPIYTKCTAVHTYHVDLSADGYQSGMTRNVEWGIDKNRFIINDSNPQYPLYFSFDGEATWQIEPLTKPEGQKLFATRQPILDRTDSTLRSQLSPGSWLGLYMNASREAQSGEDFSHMLKKPSAEFVGEEQVGEKTLLHVKLVYAALSKRKPQQRYEVWFDPSHGYLPQKIAFIEPEPDYLYIVDEFAQCREGWIPTQMRLETKSASVQFQVTDFEAPVTLPMTRFQPTLDPDCPLFDLSTKVGQKQMDEFHMIKDPNAAEGATNQKSVRSSATLPESSPQVPLVKASPNDGRISWVSWTLAASGLCGIIFGWSKWKSS